MPCFQSSLRAGLAAASILAWSISRPAYAVTVTLEELGINPNSIISDSVIAALVAVVGFGTQHRPYEPATPLGVSVGLDLSAEVTLFKIPEALFESLSAFGLPSESPLPALPVAKLHLHKGLGERFDLGGSALYFPNYLLIGGDAKLTLVQGEEGPTYSVRFCYSRASLTFNSITMATQVYSPQFLVSRKMHFADPYLGVGFAYARGAATATLTVPAELQGSIPAGVEVAPYETPVQQSFTGYAFGGVSLRIPHSGIRVTIEGSYDYAGTHTLGTKVGFTF